MKDLADPDTDVRALRSAAEAAQAVAEQAEADAREAKAVAAAARARTRATLLRQRAEAAESVDAEATGPADEPTEIGAAAEDTADHPPTDVVTDETDSAPAESTTSATESTTGTVSRLRRLRSRIAAVPRRRALAVTAALLLIAAAAGVSGFSLWQHHELAEKDQRAAEFTAAARQGVIALTSLDFNHAKEDVQRVLDNSAGAFHDDFRGRAEDFTKVVQQSQVTTEGKVNASAVESMTDDTAVVLVAATSRITNAAGAQQEPRVWRLSVTVSRVDGQLKISKVEFVP
ncbi:hypothetical protein [Nocardia goodfellowii]|uniref:Mce-associated membrane protein n=1 Tax=Nocardia goodfellowii TaxID=882446 RepID=A0ABS4QLI6_9NOCA|nr:hypothetical protein [Nocardia goodfellowii]MBP2191904.1 Mce-associated membrane protein [Nocardia goodfellowii]